MIQFVQICIGGLADGSLYALIALGFSLIYQVTGALNLAQGGFCVFAALVCYTMGQEWGVPLLLAVPAAVLFTSGFGRAIGAMSFVPGLSKLSNANLLMLTAGLLTMIEGLTLIIWGSQPYSLMPFTGHNPTRVGDILVPTQSLWVFGTTAFVIAGLWLLVARTNLGRALRACAENPAAASLMGIDVKRMTLLSFGLATLIAAVAGVVVAPTTSLQFDTGHLFTNFGFIAAVIGGMASFPGAIVGGLLLGVVTALATAYLSSLFANAIALIILLAVLVLRPAGLIQSRVSRRTDVREEARNWGRIIRLRPPVAWTTGGLAFAVAVIAPLFVTSNSVMSSLTIATILFVALIGLDLLMGYTGQVSLGQAGFMAIGGYTSGYLTIHYDLSAVMSILAGIGLSVLCAFILALVSLRLKGLYLALATLAFGLLVEACAVGFVEITGGPSGMVGIPPFTIGLYEFSSPVSMYYLTLGIVVVVLIGLFGALKSGFGRALRTIRTDQTAAAALGINIVRYKLAAFLISAALASISGSLYAFFFNFLSPEMVGSARSLELVAMMVIGGEGTLVGPILGSVIITILPTVFQPLALYKTFATGGLLVACFLYLPQGLYCTFAAWLSALTSTPRFSRVIRAQAL
ncbi:MAG: ABC transporter permease [Xanthobacteraceae bacterium]